jgi:uncharacterized protein YndB with AHSA1/START domain
MNTLPHRLDRAITIQASPEAVFRFFTDSSRWAAWWGAGSTIEARPGGRMYIRHPNGIETVGEVLEVSSPERIVFTYGYASGKPIPPGASRVSIHLEPEAGGTRVRLEHEFAEAADRDQHIQGWRFQLSVFANVVANEVHAGAAGLVEAWYAVWAEPDEQKRLDILGKIARPDIRFRDQYSLLEGLADLSAHIGASLRFMPGFRLESKGNVRHCQGTVLCDWVVVGSDGKQSASGTSVFQFGADARIASVTGVRNP